MSTNPRASIEITPEVLLKAYACGIFPMAENAHDPALYWIEPQQRGIIPIHDMQVHKRLARSIRQDQFEVRIDTDFDGVIGGCAARREGRKSTWINGKIRELYGQLFDMGHCHTVETWAGGKLVGGLYGVHLRGAFFGESMFSTERDASKTALVHLVARLKAGGFSLLDTQFVTDHLRQFGAEEIDRDMFQGLLDIALATDGDFLRLPAQVSGRRALQLVLGEASSQDGSAVGI